MSTPANELCRLITRRHNDNNDQDINDNVNGNADDNNADKNNNGNDAKSQLNSQNDKVPLSFPVSCSRDKILLSIYFYWSWYGCFLKLDSIVLKLLQNFVSENTMVSFLCKL